MEDINKTKKVWKQQDNRTALAYTTRQSVQMLDTNFPRSPFRARRRWSFAMNIIQEIDKEQLEKLSAGKTIPEFGPGDTVIVNVKVVEGERTRVQAYEGVCIGRNGGLTGLHDAAGPITRRAMLTRRRTLALLPVPFLAARTSLARTPDHVVVVGAGLSGLTAARDLQAAGLRVTVVEARNRIGGRVFSYKFAAEPDLVCELGAEWVGESHERIKALCRDFAIPLQRHQFDDYLMRDGRVVDDIRRAA